MKTILSITFLITASAFMINAQPVIEWQYSFGGSAADGSAANNGGKDYVIQTSDGGYIVGAISNSNDGDVTGHHGTAATADFWLIKLDSLGGIDWQQSYGGSEDEDLGTVIVTADGGYALIGTTQSNDGDVTGFHPGANQESDAWMIKLDSAGTIEWNRAYGGAGVEAARTGIQTNDGGFLIMAVTDSLDGDVSGNFHGGNDIWMIKTDNLGAIQWQKLIGGSKYEFGAGVMQTTDNGYIIGGTTSSGDGDAIGNTDTTITGGTWVIKTDSVGNIEWQETYGTPLFEFGRDIKQTADGNYLFGATAFASGGPVPANYHGGMDFWLLKLDNTGNIIWTSCYGGSATDDLKSLKLTNDGGFLAVGITTSSDGDLTGNNGLFDYWMMKADSVGNLEWQMNLGGSDEDFGKSVVETNDGGYLVVGESASNDGDVSGHHGPIGIGDVWVVKLSPLPTGLNEPESNIASFSIAPNPVTSNTVLNFELTKKDHILISLYDMSGRLVHTITDRKMNAGVHTVDIDTEALKLENGMYLVRVSGKNSVMTTKLIKN